MWMPSLLLLLCFGIGSVIARPAREPTRTSPSKPTLTTKPPSCLDKGCTVEQTPVWDEVLGKCVCKWGLGPPPDLCSDIMCIAEQEVHYDPETGKCGCYWIPGLEPSLIVKAREAQATPTVSPCVISCRTGWHSVKDSLTGECYCAMDNCPGIICISEQTPVYNATSGRCECEWIDGFGIPPFTFPVTSATPSSPPSASSLAARDLKVSATTTSLPCAISCLPGYHLVTDPDPSQCKCVLDSAAETSPTPTILPSTATPTLGLGCRGIVCIAEMHPIFNGTSGRCECEWIPGLEPGNPNSARQLEATPTPTPTHTTSCQGAHLFCISEMHLVYNATSQKCECEWIPGMEPGNPLSVRELQETPAPTLVPSCGGLICIPEMEPVWSAELAHCVCKYIFDLEPSTVFGGPGPQSPTETPSLTVRQVETNPIEASPTSTFIPSCQGVGLYCISEMHLVWNVTSERCECEWITGLEPSIISWGSPTGTPSITARQLETTETPTPSLVPSCQGVGLFCIAEMHLVYNATSEECECEWIPGLEPSTILWGTGAQPPATSVIPTIGFTARAEAATPTPTEETCYIWPHCISGYHLHKEGTNCTCTKDADPLPCGLRCKDGYQLETSLDTGECSCVEDTEPVCSPRCDDGQHWEETSTAGDGACVDNVSPAPCPIRCANVNGLYYDPSTGVCSCLTEEEICVEHTNFQLGTHSVWNTDTKTCSCEDDPFDPVANCIAATTCLTGSQATWDEENEVCVCVPNATRGIVEPIPEKALHFPARRRNRWHA